jgi:3-methylfumaryl-CoA hydratase
VTEREPTLEDTGFTPESRDSISRTRALAVAACLDADPTRLDAGTLPALWHWAYFVPTAPTARLGIDGHPRRRPEMDAFPQRMWVGGRVRVDQPLELDVVAARTSRVASAEVKHGGAGTFWLVTVTHEIRQDGEVRVTEEQDLVFRGASSVMPPGAELADAPEAEWVESRVADAVLLFRFSAVTNNAHRIHYDHPYATAVEGYPDLVVHGPLTAVLLAEFARARSGDDAHDLAFRARSPHFANRRFWLTGRAEADGTIHTAAIRADHAEAMTLDIGPRRSER